MFLRLLFFHSQIIYDKEHITRSLSKPVQKSAKRVLCLWLFLSSFDQPGDSYIILICFFFFGRIDILKVTQFQRWISNRIIHWFHLKRETEKLLWVSKECLTRVIHRTTRLRFAVYNIRIISFLLICLFISYFFLVIYVMKGEIFWKKEGIAYGLSFCIPISWSMTHFIKCVVYDLISNMKAFNSKPKSVLRKINIDHGNTIFLSLLYSSLE